MNRPLRDARWFDIAVVGAASLFLAWRVVVWSQRTASILGEAFFDWIFYRRAVERWLAGETLYPGGHISTLASTAGESYAYPPSSVPLMVPFAASPWGAWLWEALIAAVLIGGVFAVVRVGWRNRPWPPFALALFGLAFFVPALEGLAVANVNVATAGALGLVWAMPRLAIPSSGILGVLKVFPVALAAPLGSRAFSRALLVVAAICLVTLPLVGIQAWFDYATALSNVTPLCVAQRSNASLACVIGPLIGAGPATVLGLALSGVALLVAVRSGRTVLGMTAVVAAVMLPAAELHSHYFTLLYVLALIGLAELKLRRTERRGPAYAEFNG